MINTLLETLQFNSDELTSMSGQLNSMNQSIIDSRDTLKDAAVKLKNSWVSPAGYGFLKNKFLPLYEEMGVLSAKLDNMQSSLTEIVSVYKANETTITQRVETLKTDVIE